MTPVSRLAAAAAAAPRSPFCPESAGAAGDGAAGPRRSWSDSSLASAATAPADLACRAASGVMRSQIAGSALATIAGAKLKNAAVTGAAPTRPSGAARPAK